MKNLFKLNLVFVGGPILLCLMGFMDEKLLIWGLLSTILTGLFHIIIGFGMLLENPKDRNLQIYVASVIAFFISWFVYAQTGYNDVIGFILVFIPVILATYLTIIIYKKRNL